MYQRSSKTPVPPGGRLSDPGAQADCNRDRTAAGHERGKFNNISLRTASLPHRKQNTMQEMPVFAALLDVCLIEGKQGGRCGFKTAATACLWSSIIGDRKRSPDFGRGPGLVTRTGT